MEKFKVSARGHPEKVIEEDGPVDAAFEYCGKYLRSEKKLKKQNDLIVSVLDEEGERTICIAEILEDGFTVSEL